MSNVTQTSFKLLYWCKLMYQYEEVRISPCQQLVHQEPPRYVRVGGPYVYVVFVMHVVMLPGGP